MMEKLYAITAPELFVDESLFFAGVTSALDAGLRLLQYRDKHADRETQTRRAEKLRRLCESYDAALIINDDLEIAKQVKAHGVHLGQSDGSPSEASAALGATAMVGVTCHNRLDLASQAEKNGATYVAFGRFFHSHTKPQAGVAALSLLAEAKKTISLPIVAIGGVDDQNCGRLFDAGADVVAVCASIFASDNIKQRTRDLLRACP